MSRAFLFPGQGSQSIGMGKALFDAFPAARAVFEEVDDALSQKLSELIFTGDGEDLTLTVNAQPALMAVSVAAVRVLQSEAGYLIGEGAFVAGHSLGEYSALCAAGSIGLGDTARLLRIRGEAMQAAVPVGEGAMAVLIGADMETATALIAATDDGTGVCEIANDNAPGQVVISGTKARIDAACARARAHKIKMAKLLPVSAPFHCSLMAPAVDAMAAALEAVTIRAPVAVVIANITAARVSAPDEIRALLVRQITGRVRWVESVQAMVGAGVDDFIELGAGKVLSGLVKRIERDARVRNLATPDDLEAFA